jgi:hypothetical protein
VIDTLVADLQNYERGTWHDETQWLDVGLHACKQLNARRQVIFLTAFELSYAAEFVHRAMDDGYEIIIVPETIRRKLPSLRDALGNPIRDLDRYRDEWQDSFRFTFVDPADFSDAERAVWDALPRIFAARAADPGTSEMCGSPRPCASWKAAIKKPSAYGNRETAGSSSSALSSSPCRSSPGLCFTSCRTRSAACPM